MDSDEEEAPLSVPNQNPTTPAQCETAENEELEESRQPEQSELGETVGDGNLAGGEEDREVLGGGDVVEPLIGEEHGRESGLVEEESSEMVENGKEERVAVEGSEGVDVVEEEEILEEKNVSPVEEQAEIVEETVVASGATDVDKNDETPDGEELDDVVSGSGNVEVSEVDERSEIRQETEGVARVDGGGSVEETDVADATVEQIQTESLEDKGVDSTAEQRDISVEKQGSPDGSEVKEDLEGNGLHDVSQEIGTLETNVMSEGKEVLEMEVAEGGDGTEIEEEREEEEDDSQMANDVDEDENEEETEMEEVDVAEETETAEDTGMTDLTEGLETEAAEEREEEKEVEEEGKSSGGKRKRRKSSKALGRSRKKAEEDVCFICFDGGDLVLCDRRGCPKAYHSACVGRDESFFQSKGQWNCGVHLCSNCKKNAYYMCYTCTFSLCKGCTKDSVFFPLKGNKGFCESCRDLIMLIEKKRQEGGETSQVDFDDKSSWEYLFKDYWTDLKERLSITPDELANAKNLCKGSGLNASKQQLSHEESGSEGSNAEVTVSKRRKTRSQSKSRAKKGDSPRTTTAGGGSGKDEWASKELLDVVMHMRNGDKSVLARLELNQLILDYIKKHELRDRRNKSYVICDSRLKNLFGKPRVGHIEMLNLLDPHIYTKEDSHVDDLQGTVTDGESNQLDADWNSDAMVKGSKDKKRKPRKKGARGLQSNLDDYAAIDMHNINLIYLRRNLVEELLEDTDSFHEKAVGAFVRIRISGAGQKQDLYRLVQVIGTNKVAEPYKVGKRTTDLLLEILNLNKTEAISIDIISNQDFTEDECKRLRQSIKCGLIGRLTVGDVQEKAMALQAVRVKDWLESEIVRLSHLRDRASETGRRKELRECVEKLQLLKTPEEHQRRLDEIPEIHSDPNMDPGHESEEDEDETDDRRNDNYTRPRGNNSFGRKWGEAVSPQKGGFGSSDSWSGTRNHPNTNREFSRSLSSRGMSSKDDSVGAGDMGNEHLWTLGRDRDTHQPKSWDSRPRTPSNLETGARNVHATVMPEPSPRIVSEVSPASPEVTNAGQINESEKIWHYKDPSGKVQGPFSMVQLRKWNKNGYFPADLKIWRKTETEADSILIADALAGKFQKVQVASFSGNPLLASLQQGLGGVAAVERLKFDQNHSAWSPHRTSVEIPKHSQDAGRPETSLPSPTPKSIQQSGSLSVANPVRGDAVGLQPRALGFSDSANPAAMQSQRMQVNVQQNIVSPSSVPAAAGVTLPAQPVSYGHWNNASTGNPAGNFTTPGQMDSWRPPVQGQPNVQTPVPNLPWGMAVSTDNQNAASRPMAGNQNPNWGPMPGNSNIGWAAPVPMNTNWGNNVQGSAPGNANPGWAAAPQQGQMATNINAGWVAPGNQMSGWVQQPGQASGWAAAPGQGAVQGNANPGRAAPQNPGNNPNGDRGSHGGDSGYGGNKPYNRQSSFGGGGGSSRPSFNKRQVECPYYKNGRCKKGARCDYLHT